MILVTDPTLAGLKVLEIGGMDCRLVGAVQVDAVAREPGDVVARWGTDLLPFPDGEFDLVYASHCLEHVHWSLTLAALEDAHRVLRRGGAIEIWVPDFEYLIECYLSGEGHEDGWLDDNTYNDPMYWLNARIFTGASEDPLLAHCCMFDFAYLRRCLERAGFCAVDQIFKTRTRDHYAIQLGVRAVKI